MERPIRNISLCPTCTPGMIHAEILTHESAETCSRLLRENHADYHIFTTEEEEKGVRLNLRYKLLCIEDFIKLMLP